MSLADDIIKRKIKQPTVAKGNVADMILNNQVQAGSFPSPAPQNLSIPNLNFASRNQNTGSYASQSKITNPEINYYETKYRQELENRDKLQEAIKNNLKNQGVAVTVDPFSTNRINTTEQIPMNAIQNQRFEAINPYENLKADVENKQKYNKIKQTKEYKNQMEQLREASNKVAYAKYDLDAARVANDDIGWYDKTIGNVLGGATSILDYSSGIVKNENGDIVYLPNKSELKHQKVQESYNTGIGRFLGDQSYGLGRIGGSILLNTVVPYAGSTAYFGKMFQEDRDNAILEGYDGGDATVYALANVAGEVITGKLLGSATKGLTGGKTSGYEELLGKLVGKFTQNPLIVSFLAGAGSEATEEFIQEYADNLMKLALLDKSTNGKDYLNILTDTDVLADAAYSAGMGALTGGLLNPFQVDSNTQQSAFDEFKQQLIERRENAKTEAEVKAIDNTIEKIDELSNMSEEELIDLAKEKGLIQEEQPQATETKIEEQPQEAKTEETASKEETTSEVAIKESTEPKKKGQLQFDIKEDTAKKEMQSYKELAKENNYDAKQTRIAERIADNVISVSTSEQDLKDLTVMTSPPAKVQQTTKIKNDDGSSTTHYNPSQKIVNQGEDAVYNYVQNKVTSTEQNRIETTNEKVMQGYLKAIDKAEKDGNIPLATALKEEIDSFRYKVEHVGEKTQQYQKKLIESFTSGNSDIEMEYADLKKEYTNLIESGEWDEVDATTNNQQKQLDWIEKASVLNDFLKSHDSLSEPYSYVIKDLTYILEPGKHNAGQLLNIASQMAKRNPTNIPTFVMNELYRMFDKELKYHAGNQAWVDANNPYDLTNNSPFRLTDEEFDTITTLSSELSKIDQKNNNREYQKKLNELNNYVAQTYSNRLYGLRGILTNVKNWMINTIKIHNLASSHVISYNIASNIVDTLGLNQIERIGTNISERKLEKYTGFKTQQYTKKGASIHRKGVMEGIKAVGVSFKDGINVSDMNTKFNPDASIDLTKVGKMDYKIRAKTKLGKILVAPSNFENKIVGAALGLGDTPKATAVRNETLFNLLNQEAIRQSIKSNKDSIFYTLNDEKSGNVTYYYTDNQGNTLSRTFTSKEAPTFLNDRNQVEATDTMLKIAHDAGENAVYTNNNIFTQKAKKFSDALNSVLPGLGDLTLQFVNVTNNMAVETYRHSGLALPELIRKTNLLKTNIQNIEAKIDEYNAKGKDFTKTKEYANKMNENYELQNYLGKGYGKVLSGTVVGLTLLMLKAAGIATGDVDKDDEDKGIQDYSIKIGDKYISYDFGLFGTIAKSGAVVYDAFNGDKGILSNSYSLLKGYGESIMEQTFINQLIDTFTSEYGEDFESRLADFAIGNISSLTTPGFVKEISLALDDYTARSTYSNDKWEYLINRLNANWNRDALPKKFDGWGNTIKKGSTLIDSAWNTFFKDKFINTSKENKLDTELAELYQLTGETDILPLKSNDIYRNNVSNFSYKNTRYKLTADEKSKFSETYGKFAYDNLNKLIESDVYKNADNDTKVSYIKEIYRNALDEAKKEYLETQGIEYYNTGQKVVVVGQNDRFEQATVLDAINNNISYDNAFKKQSNPELYNYAKTITGDYNIYSHADEMYNQIKDEYKDTNDRKNAFISYVNTCSKLSSVQKAMVIKSKYKSLYKSYDKQIKSYLQSKKLSQSEYEYALNKMGIK